MHLPIRALHLILMPTEACNFRCVYCYERFEHHQMKPEVVRGVKSLMSRRAGELTRLGISWFGGEPLLARTVIENVMLHARTLAEDHGVEITGNITTNGYLLDRACFERMLDAGITHYQVTLDGSPEHHDRTRVLIGGQGTFDRIWQNVLACRAVDRPFELLIRVHVDRDNVVATPEFIDHCREALGQDGRFRIFIRPISRLGGSSDSTLPVLEGEEAQAVIGKLQARARGRPNAPGLYPPKTPTICYAAMPHSFVVRADGRINKCTVALEHPNNQIGRLREDGTMEIDARTMSPWIRGLVSGDARELQCPMEGYADPQRPTASGIPAAGSPANAATTNTIGTSAIGGTPKTGAVDARLTWRPNPLP